MQAMPLEPLQDRYVEMEKLNVSVNLHSLLRTYGHAEKLW